MFLLSIYMYITDVYCLLSLGKLYVHSLYAHV